MTPIPAHAERARRHRQRVALRQWEQRQLFTSKGVWWRLARLLGYSERGYAINRALSERLAAEGIAPDPVGLELQPPLRIHVLSAARASELALSAELVLRPTATLLTAGQIVLVPFHGEDTIPPPPEWLRGGAPAT